AGQAGRAGGARCRHRRDAGRGHVRRLGDLGDAAAVHAGTAGQPVCEPAGLAVCGSALPAARVSPAYSTYATEYYAHWGRRVGAYLMDYLLLLPGWLLSVIGLALETPTSGSRSRAASPGSAVGWVFALVGCALMLGLVIWNRFVRAGRTGHSWGKKALRIRLLRESARPP